MPLDSSARGVYAIAPTPFLPNGALDTESIARMTEFYADAGVDGLTVLGLMGEAQKLAPEESLQVVRGVLDRFGGRPTIVGVSAPGFEPMRRLAREAIEAGAAGVMLTPPTAMRTDDQIVAYVRQAIKHIGADVPFVIQDHPTATGVVMSEGVIRRIVEENASCFMLKHEDWPGLEKISTLRRWQAAGEMRPISILSGNGALFLDFEMNRGADGAMTGYAFPEMLIDVVRHYTEGDRAAAHDIFDAHLPLLRYEQQMGVGLAIRKHILAHRGAIAHADLRAPGKPISKESAEEVEFLLRRLARRDARVAPLA